MPRRPYYGEGGKAAEGGTPRGGAGASGAAGAGSGAVGAGGGGGGGGAADDAASGAAPGTGVAAGAIGFPVVSEGRPAGAHVGFVEASGLLPSGIDMSCAEATEDE